MVKVCARYCGTIILLEEFETIDEAEDFMTHDFLMFHSDELETGEDEYIYPDEMFIDTEKEEVPFCEPLTFDEIKDELPF